MNRFTRLFHSQPGRLALLGLLLGALAISNALRPLQGVHWDAPIYLYQAKRFAETPLVASYMRHADVIAGQALGTHPLPEGEAYPESYWRFTRLGHIALLGGIVAVLGSSENAILAASLVYAAILAMAAFWSVLAVLALSRIYESQETSFSELKLASVVGGSVYAVSGGHVYMTGNLVAEVPALFCMAIGTWLIALAVLRERPALAIVSGLLAYLTYAIKMEAVWFFAAVYLALWLTPLPSRSRLDLARVIAWAAVAALAGYSLHSALFYPLTAPDTFLAFNAQVNEALASERGVSDLVPWVACGGLWLGIPLAMFAGLDRPLVRFAWLWLLLASVPLLAIYYLGSVQTRMFTPLVPPLLLLFTLGLGNMMGRLDHRPARHLLWEGLAGTLIVTFLIAHPVSYQALYQLPGAWRLQYVRQYLWPPTYEVRAYPVSDMHRLSRSLYGHTEPVWLMVGSDIPQEYLNLVRFFGPAYPAGADLAATADPTNLLPCTAWRPESEPVVYRTGSAMGCCTLAGENSVLKLDRVPPAAQIRETILFQTGDLAITNGCSN